MLNTPLVSVLMTAYNREKYIAEAIESVLESTYSNLELIIIDDCSKDNTLKIASSYAQRDNRIKLHFNARNLGQFENRNKAASLAKGKYIKYVDSDDMIKPDTLMIMAEGMERYKRAGIGVVYTNKNKIDLSTVSYKSLDSRTAYLWHYSNGGLLFPGPTGCIYNTQQFLNQHGFPVDLGINGDIYLNLKIASVSEVVVFPDELVYWRKHSNQVDELQQDYFKMHQERYQINRKVLFGEYLPLNQFELKRIRLSNKVLYIRGAVNNYLVKGKVNNFLKLMRAGNVPLYDLPLILLPLRYLNSFKDFLKRTSH